MGKRVVAWMEGRFAKQNSRDIFQMAVLLEDPQVEGLTTLLLLQSKHFQVVNK